MKKESYFLITCIYLLLTLKVVAQGDGFLIKENKRIFPIGWYYLPEDDNSLKELTNAGVNIIRCSSKEDLDRVHKFGIQGWMPLRLEEGATENFKEKLYSVIGHPALALWEGPDEIVLRFTQDYQYKMINRYDSHKGITTWRNRTKEMENYSKTEGTKVIKKMHEAISFLRMNDPNNLQVWMNEGAHSSPFYIRQYLDSIDIIGCDHYPIFGERKDGGSSIREIESIGYVAEQFNEIGIGKPVYMVLQAYSKHEEGSGAELVWFPDYPPFKESRFMAYDAIVHGSRGIFYWGANTIGKQNTESSGQFRQSLYALTSELNSLQPFLTAPEQEHITAYYMKDFQRKEPSGSLHKNEIAWSARQHGRDWLIILVNDDNVTLQNVGVTGLKHLNGMKFKELYGDEEVTVTNEEFLTRLKPYEVKVFSTDKKWESTRISGRNYEGYKGSN